MYYPPLTDDSEIGTGVVRIRAHTDYETIILLFQDDVGGLEVIYANKLRIVTVRIHHNVLKRFYHKVNGFQLHQFLALF